jgi:hypothetical protein
MRLARLAVCLVAWALGAFLLSRGAVAHPLSDYEKESLRIALKRVGAELDPAPDHKWIEGIDVVALDVIEPRDPAPEALNWFHVTSRAHIVEREMLLKVGDQYDRDLVAETERNLRVRQVSVVLVVPTKGSAPDRLRLLVVTKDVWSLRVNFEPVFVNGHLQSLYLQPSEENLFGRHKTINANVFLERATYSLGIGYSDPRIGGSRIQTAWSANVVWNCRTGDVEGSNGTFFYGKPLYAKSTRWGWSAAARWNQGVVRPMGTTGQSICSGDQAVALDFKVTPGNDNVPYQYYRDTIEGQLTAVRSFGVAEKADVSFGLETDRRVYEPPDLSGHPEVVREAFLSLLPVSDMRISPFAQVHAYPNRYLRVLNFEVLGLQEDYALGYDLWLRGYPALQALGSTRNLMGVYGGAGYTAPFEDGLARVYASSTVELSAPETTDGQVLAGVRVVTPGLAFGRVVLDGYVLDRFANYLNPTYSLGGTTRLRGYRTQAFVGPNVVVTNVELRTRPVEILSVQVGAVAFYDVGNAFYDFSSMSLRHGAGAGLRFLLPQVERIGFRIDVGFPLNPRDPAAETSVVAQFGQAFPMPSLSSPALVP